MNWYEGIFGKDIWKSLAMEVSFWGHSDEEKEKRMDNRRVC